MASEEVPTTATSIDANTVNAAAEQHARPDSLLVPQMDAAIEAAERRRWGRLLQGGIFHRRLLHQRWDAEALLRGLLHRPRPVAARTAVRATTTSALLVTLNINPALWLGENENENENEDEDGASTRASRLYTWSSPALLPGDNGSILDELSQRLESQYRSLSKRSLMVSYFHNARIEEFVRTLLQCRHQAGPSSKVIIHYGGHGVPQPRSGSFYLYPQVGEAVKYPLDALCSHVGFPLVMIADCPNAGSILHRLLENRQKADMNQHFTYGPYKKGMNTSKLEESERPTDMMMAIPTWERYENTSFTGMENKNMTPLVSPLPGNNSRGTLSNIHGLNSCRGVSPSSPRPPPLPAHASPSASPLPYDDFFFIGSTQDGPLPHHPRLPSDILTSCLTTPLRMLLLWFIIEHTHTSDIHPLLIYLIPGDINDKKTPLGELQWAFMSITECIAWSALPYTLFVHLFREDVVIAPLFRGFLLADRIITALGGELSVYPPFPKTCHHVLWDTLDNIIDRTFVSLWRAVRPTPPPVLHSVEFREWLDWNVIRWKYEMETMPLPSLGDRCVVVPNFLQEELSCLSTEVERITEQSFSRLTTMMDQYPREEEQCQRQGEREGVEEEEEEKEKRGGGGSGEKRGKLGSVGNSSTITLRRSRKEEEGGDNPLFFLRAHHNASSGLKPFPHILRLPMLLQGLLVLSHRDQATYLVCRLIDAGPLAVSACAEVGIFNMALVHYWSRRDLRHLLPTLLFIYAKACYTDPSLGGGTDTTQRRVIIDACREIMENPIVMMPAAAAAGSSVEPGAWQRDVLGSWAESQGQRLLAVSLLTTICMYSLEARNQCRECGVLRLCCELLQSVAATAPRVPWILLSSTPEKAVRETKREESEENESEKEGIRDGHGENNNNVIESKDPAVMTTYILGLIALFVTLSWEGELSVNNTSEKEDGESEREELYSAWGLRQYISSSLDALQLLLTSTYSTVRGASFKAITAVLVSRITDEETALKCVRLITMRIGVQEPPGEGNTDNRLELVGGLSMSIKWLIERLSPRLSLEKIRNAVCYELKKAGRVVFGTLPHGCDEKTRRSHDTDIFPGRALSPHEGSPLSPSTIVHETDDLLDMLVRLTCQLEVVTNDSCPFVVAHSQKVLREVLTMLDVQQLSFLRHTSDAPFGHVDTSTISRNSGITHFFSGVINTLTSRTGGGGVQQRPRESARQRNQVSNSIEGDEGDDGDDDYDGDSMEEILDPSSSNTVSEQDGASDILASPRTLSIHGNSTIFSFIFTLLSFLDELLLVPVDDCDPRHPFNLEKEACLLKYLRQLRDELRVSAVPHDSYNYARENEGRPVVLPLLSYPSALWNYPVSLPVTLPREDEARGHKPKLSPLLDNTTSPFPGNVDSPTSWSKDCQNHFQLLAEKNIFSERDGHIQVMTFHPTERHFVTGTSQGVIQVWSLADRDAPLLPPPPPPPVAVAVEVAGGGGSSSLASSSPSAGPVARRAGDPCRLLARIQLSEVVRRQGFTIPPSTVLRYMYSTYPVRAMSSRCFRHGPSMSGDGVMMGGEMFDVSPVRQGNYARGCKGADPLTGLHLIDSAYRTLLCAVGRSGSVQIFSGYTNKRTIKRITSFGTMTYEEALRSHQCLSSYHVPAILLHVSGADGSITTWDLNCEQKISEETGRREYTHSPTSLASHPYDVFSFAVGAGSIYLYDLRDSSRCTHVLPDPTSLGQPVQRQERSLGNYNKPLCLHIGFPCRYPHGLVTGYGGEQGVVMLWDDRKLQRPILQTVVSDMRGTSASSLNSVGFMDVQHYHHALMTLSVTADALFISDALSLSSSSSSFEGNANRTHIPLRQQTSATSFHPVLPLCGVAGGGVLQLYARGKPLMPNQKA